MKIKEFNPISSKYEDISNIDEAEALVTTYPNSSKAWMLYMVWHLRQAEINKSRGIAYRALKTINYRLDKEKLNVWKALLNLENAYGTKETVQKVFKEVCQYQDQQSIYQHMLEVYVKKDNSEELEELSKIVRRKFKLIHLNKKTQHLLGIASIKKKQLHCRLNN